jgi:hypothetical protein
MPIDYKAIASDAAATSLQELIVYLRAELPHAWFAEYAAASNRPANVMTFRHGAFEYVYDHYTALEASGEVAYDATVESRLVAVCGVSAPRNSPRDDYRLRGWVGPTGRMFGSEWDKGHFIAHSIGGAVDGFEANVYLQKRALNRGWSPEGKRFRSMEKYCCANGGTFCFCRPIYEDGTARPAEIEFGVLRGPADLWVERFDNR